MVAEKLKKHDKKVEVTLFGRHKAVLANQIKPNHFTTVSYLTWKFKTIEISASSKCRCLLNYCGDCISFFVCKTPKRIHALAGDFLKEGFSS